MADIRFVIPKNGKGIVIDHQGFVGPACYRISGEIKRIMATMGIEFAEEEITPKDDALQVEDVAVEDAQTEKVGE